MCFANFMFLLKRGTWHSKGQCSLIQEPSNKSFWKLYSCAFCTAPCSVVQFWNQSVCSTRNWQNLKWSLKFELLSTSGNREPLRLSAVEYRGDRFPAENTGTENLISLKFNTIIWTCVHGCSGCVSQISALYISSCLCYQINLLAVISSSDCDTLAEAYTKDPSKVDLCARKLISLYNCSHCEQSIHRTIWVVNFRKLIDASKRNFADDHIVNNVQSNPPDSTRWFSVVWNGLQVFTTKYLQSET